MRNYPDINKIFDDLENFKDFCRFNGKVFDEKDLYDQSSYVWKSYQSYLYRKSKMRNNNKRYTK